MTAIGPKECPNDDGWASTAVAAVVGDDGPEVAALRGLPARVQHRRACLVAPKARFQRDEDPVGGAQMGLHVVDHGPQVEAGATDPVAQRAAVEVETLPLEDPGLAVERYSSGEGRLTLWGKFG